MYLIVCDSRYSFPFKQGRLGLVSCANKSTDISRSTICCAKNPFLKIMIVVYISSVTHITLVKY